MLHGGGAPKKALDEMMNKFCKGSGPMPHERLEAVVKRHFPPSLIMLPSEVSRRLAEGTPFRTKHTRFAVFCGPPSNGHFVYGVSDNSSKLVIRDSEPLASGKMRAAPTKLGKLLGFAVESGQDFDSQRQTVIARIRLFGRRSGCTCVECSAKAALGNRIIRHRDCRSATEAKEEHYENIQ